VRITGFTKESLKNGKPLDEVQNQFMEVVTDKLIISYAGTGDFQALELVTGDFTHFDLSRYFQKWNGQLTKGGEKVYQPIGLRSVYWHFFKKDIQDGVHSATKDAIATLELFEIYKIRKTKNMDFPYMRDKDDEFNEIVTKK